MVICLKRGADLHMAQLMPLPLTISCSSKIQIGFTFLVPAHLGSPGQRAVKGVCVCVCENRTKVHNEISKSVLSQYQIKIKFSASLSSSLILNISLRFV